MLCMTSPSPSSCLLPPTCVCVLLALLLHCHANNNRIKVAVDTQQGLMKQSSLEDPFDNGNDEDSAELANLNGSDDDLPPTPPRPSTPVPANRLPWTPKVRWVGVNCLKTGQQGCPNVICHPKSMQYVYDRYQLSNLFLMPTYIWHFMTRCLDSAILKFLKGSECCFWHRKITFLATDIVFIHFNESYASFVLKFGETWSIGCTVIEESNSGNLVYCGLPFISAGSDQLPVIWSLSFLFGVLASIKTVLMNFTALSLPWSLRNVIYYIFYQKKINISLKIFEYFRKIFCYGIEGISSLSLWWWSTTTLSFIHNDMSGAQLIRL